MIPNRVSIDERPASVDSKRYYGDWEGDFIVGGKHRGAALTLVERKTKHCLIHPLDPNSLISELLEAWSAGAEVVLAERKSRKEAPVRLFLMNLYHRYFGMLSDFKMPANIGLYCTA